MSRADEYEEHLRQRAALSRTSVRYMDPRQIDASLNALRDCPFQLSVPLALPHNGAKSPGSHVDSSPNVLQSADLRLGPSQHGAKSAESPVKSPQGGVEAAEVLAKSPESSDFRPKSAAGQRSVTGEGQLGDDGVAVLPVLPAPAGKALGTYRSRGNMQMAGSMSGSRARTSSGGGNEVPNGTPGGARQQGSPGARDGVGAEGPEANEGSGASSKVVMEGKATMAASEASAALGDDRNVDADGSGSGSLRAGVLDIGGAPKRSGSLHAGAGSPREPPEGDPLLLEASHSGRGSQLGRSSFSLYKSQGAHVDLAEKKTPHKTSRWARHKRLREWTSGRRPSFVERMETRQWEWGPNDYEIVTPLRELAEKVLAERGAKGQVAGGTEDKAAVQSPETGEPFLAPPSCSHTSDPVIAA